MCRYPRLSFSVQKRFRVTVTAVRQRRYKYIRGHDFTRIGIYHLRCLSCPVHLYRFARFVINMHCRFRFYRKFPVVFLELRQLIRYFVVSPAFLAVFHPLHF
jgi:hypothetical protein